MNLMKCLWALLIFCAISVAHGNDTTPPQCGVALPKKTLQPLSTTPTSAEFKSAATNIYNIKHNCPGGADKNFYVTLEDNCDHAANQMQKVEEAAKKALKKHQQNSSTTSPLTTEMNHCINDYNNWASLSNAASPFVTSWCGQKQGVAPKGTNEFPHYGEIARELRAAAKKCNGATGGVVTHLNEYALWCDWSAHEGKKAAYRELCHRGYKKLYNPWVAGSGMAKLGGVCEGVLQGTDSACACMNKYTVGQWNPESTLGWLQPQSIVTYRPDLDTPVACDRSLTMQSPAKLRACQDIQACCKLLNGDSACPTQ